MKKKLIILLTVVMCVGLLSAGCSNDNSDDAYETEYEEETDADDEDLYSSSESDTSEDTSNTSTSSSSTASTTNTTTSISHYCQASGCTREGTRTMTGVSGATEYYCQTHYDEIQNTLGTMEQSVGSGTASKHHCEECSKEGTHSLTGLSGATEYYCTEHYNEIMEMLEALSGE